MTQEVRYMCGSGNYRKTFLRIPYKYLEWILYQLLNEENTCFVLFYFVFYFVFVSQFIACPSGIPTYKCDWLKYSACFRIQINHLKFLRASKCKYIKEWEQSNNSILKTENSLSHKKPQERKYRTLFQVGEIGEPTHLKTKLINTK